MRKAFFGTYADGACEYLLQADVEERLRAGERLVSATFVTPYPPGFPVLVPGQVITADVLEFMASLDTPEVHGYEAELGYRVYCGSALPAVEVPARSGLGSTPVAAAAPAANGDGGGDGEEFAAASAAGSGSRGSHRRGSGADTGAEVGSADA
jgi:arginine decarboxylase